LTTIWTTSRTSSSCSGYSCGCSPTL
jgi:hypothetical protein